MTGEIPQVTDRSSSGRSVPVSGLKLRTLRMNAGLGLRELARRAGISPSFLSEIEHGTRFPSPPVAQRLATELGVAIIDLRR